MVHLSYPRTLPTALCEFGKLVLPFLGANLHALRKKYGGIRPITQGLALHRFASKIANRWATEPVSSKLAPRQLEDGVRDGSEAIIYAARKNSESKMYCRLLDDNNNLNLTNTTII